MGALKNCSESLSAQEFTAIHRHLLGEAETLFAGASSVLPRPWAVCRLIFTPSLNEVFSHRSNLPLN